MAAATFLDWVEGWSPSWALGELSAGWYGLLCGMQGDLIAEGMRVALVGAWLSEPDSPDDVLPLAGAEYRMPRYPAETSDQYRARLLTAFTRHANAGTFARIDEELADAGITGTCRSRGGYPGPTGYYPHWSQFVVETDAFEASDLALIEQITRRWKSVRWIYAGTMSSDAPPLTGIGALAIGDGCFGE